MQRSSPETQGVVSLQLMVLCLVIGFVCLFVWVFGIFCFFWFFFVDIVFCCFYHFFLYFLLFFIIFFLYFLFLTFFFSGNGAKQVD